MNSQRKIVLLETCLDETQAEIIRGVLQSHDIPCFLENTHTNRTMPHLQLAIGGVRIMVLDSHLDEARTIIKETFPDSKDLVSKSTKQMSLFRKILSTIVSAFAGAPIPLKKKNGRGNL